MMLPDLPSSNPGFDMRLVGTGVGEGEGVDVYVSEVELCISPPPDPETTEEETEEKVSEARVDDCVSVVKLRDKVADSDTDVLTVKETSDKVVHTSGLLVSDRFSDRESPEDDWRLEEGVLNDESWLESVAVDDIVLVSPSLESAAIDDDRLLKYDTEVDMISSDPPDVNDGVCEVSEDRSDIDMEDDWLEDATVAELVIAVSRPDVAEATLELNATEALTLSTAAEDDTVSLRMLELDMGLDTELGSEVETGVDEDRDSELENMVEVITVCNDAEALALVENGQTCAKSLFETFT